MKIFSDELIETPQSKFIEVGNKVIINADVFDLNTLTQIPYSNYVNNTINHNQTSIVSKITSMNTRYHEISSDNPNRFIPAIFSNHEHCVQDAYDPNIYYVTLIASRKPDVKDAARVEKLIDQGDNILKTGLYFSNSSLYIRYIDQDEKYLYLEGSDQMYASVLSTTQNYIYKVEKTTMKVIRTDSMGYCYGCKSVIYRDEEYIIFNFDSNGSARNSLFARYRKSDGVIKFFNNKSYSSCDSFFSDCEINTLLENNSVFIYSLNENNSTSTTVPGIEVVELNVSPEAVGTDNLKSKVATKCSISWPSNDIRFKTDFDNTTTQMAERIKFITKVGDKKYFNAIIYQPTATTPNARWVGIYTFEIVSRTELKFTSRLKFEGKEKNPLFIGRDNITDIYVPSDTALYYIKFNPLKEGFEIINTKPIVVTSLGLDNLGRVWAIDKTAQLHMFSETLVERVNIKFENTKLDYTGSDLNTALIVNCTNNNGKKIVFDVELSLSGNATFTDGTRKIQVKTIENEDLKIPLVINGPGQISIYPRVIL